MPESLLSLEKRNPLMLEPRELAEVLLAEITNKYRLLEVLLGEKEAQHRLRPLTKRRRGAPTGPRRPDRDFDLLLLHDALISQASRKSQTWSERQTGDYLHKSFRGQYGTTALGIKRKLERLQRPPSVLPNRLLRMNI
jgi:hypothetical protein